tara:strand:+ start:20709 stop:21119 length:411 start_codon:yes stop_codon:yes gene_type:complete
MDAEDHVKLLDRAYNFQLALVSHGNLGSDGFVKVQKEAKELFKDIEGETRPWLGRSSREDRSVQEQESFAIAWEDATGFSLDDPEAMAEWEERLAGAMTTVEDGLKDKERNEADDARRFNERLEEISNKRKRQQGR